MTSYSQATEYMKQSASQHQSSSKNLSQSLSESDSEDEPIQAGKPGKVGRGKSTKPVIKAEEDEMASQLESLANAHAQVLIYLCYSVILRTGKLFD